MEHVMPRYRVIGPRFFLGNRPGSEFEATLAPEVVERALARRSIELVAKSDKARATASEPPEETAEPSPLVASEPESED